MHKPPIRPVASLVYPDSDGKPMADNTKQMRWIMLLFGNLSGLFGDRPDVFVAANLFWYAVEGQPEERTTPDVMVAFGRPKGDRGSYKQWEEGGVAPQVVFEVLSPLNTVSEMEDKHSFYEEHGVEEYYLYDPDSNRLQVFVRQDAALRPTPFTNEFTSPRLGIRFDLTGEEMAVYEPTWRKFLTFEDLYHEVAQARIARLQAETARLKAETATARARTETARAKTARVMELSRKVRRGQATAEELRELDQLENESLPPPP